MRTLTTYIVTNAQGCQIDTIRTVSLHAAKCIDARRWTPGYKVSEGPSF